MHACQARSTRMLMYLLERLADLCPVLLLGLRVEDVDILGGGCEGGSEVHLRLHQPGRRPSA
eukprot:347492-Rhodomonas_salina.2